MLIRLFLLLAAALGQICFASVALAHPAPVSSLDLTYKADRIEGALTVHTADIARQVGIGQPQTLLDEGVLIEQYTAINDILAPRIVLRGGDGARIPVGPLDIEPLPADDALHVAFIATTPPPAALSVSARLFPDDPNHRTFVNVYEGGALTEQFLFGADSPPRTHYAGTAAGAKAVLGDFVPLGMWHVWMGFDHLAFVIGLLLLGGSLRRLAAIVTAFTLGHSFTLALAALDLLVLPGWFVEPAIALSIVVVGADNLMRGEGRDLRAGLAALFGLIHGFGFATVLRDTGLPPGNLAWSLLGFNVGVELGQLAVVLPLAGALALVRRRSVAVANGIAKAGSLAVIAAGVYWFVDRVQNLGSGI